MTLDAFFMSEWDSRRPGEGRSLPRARRLAEALGLLGHDRPVLSVVGSKGKGTAAIYASAYLAAAGLRVVTVTSPGYRHAAERIRVDGRALTAATLLGLAARLRAARDSATTAGPGGDGAEAGGYLAPTGLFTLAGVLHAQDVAADAMVLEAGMGGVCDEISLFAPAVVALTAIFAEHVGKLGDTPAEIARNKAGIVTPATRAVLTVPQTADVAHEIAETAAGRSGGRTGVEVIGRGSTGISPSMFPAGLSALNAELGCAAARRLLGVTGRAAPAGARLTAVLGSVRLPGRLSRHTLPGGTELIVDSAINRAGIVTALTVAATWWTAVDHVLLCMPDHKDVAGAIRALAGLPVTFVRLPDERLRFSYPLPAGWRVIDAAQLTRELVSGLGRRVLALGTVYFTGRVLDLADADTEQLFRA